MAQFELNIYGNDDAILKTFTTDKVRWGVFMQALDVKEGLEGKDFVEQFKIVTNFIKKIFPSITDADLENADVDDVFNTFRQLIRKAESIKGTDEKN